MEAHELIEQTHEAQEHSGGGHGGGISRYIGLTMAVLGVLLALCSALVGSARTSLVTTMVAQTNAALDYQSLSNKYRLMQAQLQQLHALLPDPKVFKAADEEIQGILKASAGNPAQASLARIMNLESQKLLTTVTPTKEDLLRFADFMKTYDKQQKASKEYTESFESKVEAYEEAAEHFEWAQLCCEVAIVTASVALLLANRFAWMFSIVAGCIGVVLIVVTFTQTNAHLTSANHKINEAHESFVKLVDEKADEAGDAKLIHDIETGQ